MIDTNKNMDYMGRVAQLDLLKNDNKNHYLHSECYTSILSTPPPLRVIPTITAFIPVTALTEIKNL